MAKRKKKKQPVKYDIVQAGDAGVGAITELIEKLGAGGGGGRGKGARPVIIVVNNTQGVRPSDVRTIERLNIGSARDKVSGFQELGSLCDTPKDYE